MTILHIVEAFGGGIVSYLEDLTRGQIRMGYNVVVAFNLRPETPKDFKSDFDEKIVWIYLENLKKKIGIKDVKAFFEIRRIVKKVSPDIVHTHSSKAGVVGRLSLVTSKIPLFYTPHGYSFLMESVSPFKRFLYKGIEWFVALISHSTTIACSEGEYIVAKKLNKNSTYINNGVSPHFLDEYVGGITFLLNDGD